MLSIRTNAQAQAMASAFGDAFKALGRPIDDGQMLDALAIVQGFPSYAEMLASFAPTTQETPAPEGQRLPCIQAVDFMAVHAIVIGDTCYDVVWREMESLRHLQHGPQSNEVLDHADDAALHLQRSEDGLVWDEYISLGKLASWTWNTELQVFFDDEGIAYSLFFEEDAETHFRRRGLRVA